MSSSTSYKVRVHFYGGNLHPLLGMTPPQISTYEGVAGRPSFTRIGIQIVRKTPWFGPDHQYLDSDWTE